MVRGIYLRAGNYGRRYGMEGGGSLKACLAELVTNMRNEPAALIITPPRNYVEYTKYLV